MLEIVLPCCKKQLLMHKLFIHLIYTHSFGVCDRNKIWYLYTTVLYHQITWAWDSFPWKFWAKEFFSTKFEHNIFSQINLLNTHPKYQMNWNIKQQWNHNVLTSALGVEFGGTRCTDVKSVHTRSQTFWRTDDKHIIVSTTQQYIQQYH